MKQQLTGWENFWYYFTVIGSLGGVFTIKVLVKKAIVETSK